MDKAYDRALRAVEGSRGRKRRKVAMEKVDSAGGGGGGGFVVEEDVEMSDSGGGFVPDEEEDEGRMETSIGGGGGGFVADEQDISPAPSPSLRSLLPLTSLPSAINSLGLEWDEDVLAVFQSQSTDQSDGATKRDFRAVCAAMMEVEADDGEDEQGDEMNMSDDSEDEYQGVEQENAGSESPLSPLSDGYEEDSTITDRRRRRPPPASDPSMRADVPTVKLSRDQKDFISRMWETMFEGSERERGQRLLGRDQVKRWAGIMGEMWGDEEVSRRRRHA